MIKIIKKNLRYLVPFFLFISVFTMSCHKNPNTEQAATTPGPSATPEERPESYQNDIEEYEPTDSLSQDSDGPVH